MATSNYNPESSEPTIVNPNLRALEIVHRLNRYDPDAIRQSLEAAQARYPNPNRENDAQRISRLARVVGESFNHLSTTDNQEVK